MKTRCKILISLFLSLVAFGLSSRIQAQSAQRVWATTLPAKIQSIVIFSRDCSMYAYQLDDSSIVRADAFNGAPIDTVTTRSVVSIAYCGNRLYALKEYASNYPLVYFEPSTKMAILTVFNLNEGVEFNGAFRVVTGSLHAFGEEPRLIIHRRISSSAHFGYYTEDGAILLIDTTTHVISNTLQCGYGLHGPSVASDGGSVVYGGTSSSSSNPPSNMLADVALPVGNVGRYFWGHQNDISDFSNGNPVSTGIRGLVYTNAGYNTNGGVIDLRYKTSFGLDQSAPYMLANLGSGGLMLGVHSDSLGRIIGAYELSTKAWTSIDTFAVADVSYLRALVFGNLNAAFVTDYKTFSLRRYSLQSKPQRDTSTFERSVDTVNVYGSAICKVKLVGYRDGLMFRWFLDDRVIDTTSVASFTIRPTDPGVFAMKVEILDSSGSVLGTANSQKPFVVNRPAGLSMVFRVDTAAIRMLSLSPNANLLAVNVLDRRNVHRLPSPLPLDFSAPIIRTYIGSGSTSFMGSNDSVLHYEGTQSAGQYFDGHEITCRWSAQSLTADSLRLVAQIKRNISIESLDPYLGDTRGDLWFNRATESWISLIQVRVQQPPYDALVVLPKQQSDTVRVIAGHSKNVSDRNSARVADAEVGYRQFAVWSGWSGIYIADLFNQQTEGPILYGGDVNLLSAALANDTTLVSNRGLFSKDTAWKLTQPFKFTDGLKVLRLPVDTAYLILRANVDTVAEIISSKSGQTLSVLGPGFGKPTCVIFDRERSAVHVGDDSGFVSTWTLSPELTTTISERDSARVEEGRAVARLHDVRIIPNPVDDAFTIEGLNTPTTDATVITLANITGQSVALVPLGDRMYSLSGVPPGVYVVVMRNGNRVHTQLLVKR